MLVYTIKRVGTLIFVLLGVLVIAFVITHVVPADPARVVAGLRATPEQVAKIRESMGLNDPIYVQFGRYISQLLRGDLGTSFVTSRSISRDLILYFPATLELVLAATILFLAVGIPLGIFCAVYSEHQWVTFLAKFAAIIGMGMPVFWLGLLFQIVFYAKMGLLPAAGRIAFDVAPPARITSLFLLDSLLSGNMLALKSSLLYLILPALTLASNRFGVTLRLVRSEMLRVMSRDYVRTAWAKGLPKRSVIRHALRNALIPVITMTGLQFGWLLGGSLLVETVFGWPGLGRYAYDSIAGFDFPAVMGVVLLITLCFAVINLIVDLSYGFLDPRIVYD